MKRKSRKGRPAWPESKDRLMGLPIVVDEVWQAGIRRFPGWTKEGGKPSRPWTVLAVHERGVPVFAATIVPDPPGAEQIWAVLEKAMLEPISARSHRPAEVQVCSPQIREGISLRLEAIGSRCVLREALPGIDAAAKAMEVPFRSEGDRFAIVLVPGLARERVAALFAAAAEYYRKRPWTLVESDTIFRVDCARLEKSPWYAVPIGQEGTHGLAIYDDLEGLRTVIKEELRDQAAFDRTSSVSTLFVPPYEMPIPDLDAAEAGGWPIAGPQAHPTVYRIHRGGKIRQPESGEVEAMIVCLRAVPAFLDGQGVDADPEVKVARLK